MDTSPDMRLATHDNSVIEVNLAAIEHNMGVLRRIVGPECRICPLIKADAYGLGAVRIAKTLTGCGAMMLAVYSHAEAAELIRKAIGARLLVLMPVHQVDRVDELYRWMISNRLELAVHFHEQLENTIHVAEHFGAAIPVHLEVDTGMSRGGCAIEEAPELLRRIKSHPRLRLAGLFTHFADSESDPELTDSQLARFEALLEEQRELIPADCTIHMASTFATLRAAKYHMSMVRIGLAWAGYGIESLEGGESMVDAESLQPAVMWRSKLIQIRTIPKGATVGYGARWTAKRKSVIGLVPAGYADGFPPLAGATDRKRKVAQIAILHQQDDETVRTFVPVVGAVNMDQITVDLTDCVKNAPEGAIGVGTPVELITPDVDAPNHLPHLAEVSGTFAHELLSRLHPRLKRVYKSKSPAEIIPSTVRVATTL